MKAEIPGAEAPLGVPFEESFFFSLRLFGPADRDIFIKPDPDDSRQSAHLPKSCVKFSNIPAAKMQACLSKQKKSVPQDDEQAGFQGLTSNKGDSVFPAQASINIMNMNGPT